ncbi:MAG TPA: hypothetical protein VGU25_12105 [Acidobacteriaceae bacterium]|nr:hypothetical protein [Acidobacteriaceae bacterium]
MEFVKLFLRVLGVLPRAILNMETMFAGKSGEQKKHAVLGVVTMGLNVLDAVEQKQIVDADGFSAGLGSIVDGVVACLNASVWHKG